jgi:hypothetical protein
MSDWYQARADSTPIDLLVPLSNVSVSIRAAMKPHESYSATICACSIPILCPPVLMVTEWLAGALSQLPLPEEPSIGTYTSANIQTTVDMFSYHMCISIPILCSPVLMVTLWLAGALSQLPLHAEPSLCMYISAGIQAAVVCSATICANLFQFCVLRYVREWLATARICMRR